MLPAAVESDYTEIVKILLAAIADVNVRILDSGRTALHVTTEQNNKKLIDVLLKAHAEVNAIDINLRQTPLDLAKLYGHRVVERLLKNGWSKDKG